MLILHSIGPNVVGTFGAQVIIKMAELPNTPYYKIEEVLRYKIQYEIDSHYGDGQVVVPNLIGYIKQYIDDDRYIVIFTAEVRLDFLETYLTRRDIDG